MSVNAAPDSTPDPLEALELAAALTVRDLDASSRWYRHTLGFTLDRRHEHEGKLIAISLQAGTVRLLLTQDDGAAGTERVKGVGFSLQLTTAQDIDALATRARAQGATLDTEPVTMPWGIRIFRLRDPDGFRFTISSPRPS